LSPAEGLAEMPQPANLWPDQQLTAAKF